MNIYGKINKIMQNIEYLTKDDKVEFGTTKYKAISEEKVTTAVRKQLVEQGIVILPIKQESTNKELARTEKIVNMLTEVHVTYQIQNIEDKDDFVIVESTGTGVDTQDKGVGKAMTYAYKYMLLRTFAIPTGEDPYNISSNELDKKFEEQMNKDNAEEKFNKEVEILRNQTITEIHHSALIKAIEKYSISDEQIQAILQKYNYTNTIEILNKDYADICKDFEKVAKPKNINEI